MSTTTQTGTLPASVGHSAVSGSTTQEFNDYSAKFLAEQNAWLAKIRAKADRKAEAVLAKYPIKPTW